MLKNTLPRDRLCQTIFSVYRPTSSTRGYPGISGCQHDQKRWFSSYQFWRSSVNHVVPCVLHVWLALLSDIFLL